MRVVPKARMEYGGRYLWSKYHGAPMHERIHFGTKDEHNARREREFLALTPHERFLWFLRSFDRRVDPPAPTPRATGNFVIRRRA